MHFLERKCLSLVSRMGRVRNEELCRSVNKNGASEKSGSESIEMAGHAERMDYFGMTIEGC